MKKVILLLAAMFSALICTELVVAKVVGFPTYGVQCKMLDIRGSREPVNIFKPHSKYWTVEGGNKVFQRNNVGLYGVDVIIRPESKYVFVLGNSFVEAMQVPPDQIATSIFQRCLNKLYKSYQVLNISKSGHDPYDLFWRARYFENSYSPAGVILVMNIESVEWLKRYKTALSFDSAMKRPRVLRSSTMKYLSPLLNHSSFINLSYWLLKSVSPTDQEISAIRSVDTRPGVFINSRLRACLDGFYHRYGKRFCVIADSQVEESHPDIEPYCRQKRIHYISGAFTLPQHRINGTGHLNQSGNKALGDSLYEAFETIH